MEGRVLANTSQVEGGNYPPIATPTTKVNKRTPGRAMSTDFRIISDIRCANLFCEKEDYPAVNLADIEQIAEKDIATKMRWPHLSILRNKRDVDAAFKRVMVRPDMAAILRTEFQPSILGIGDSAENVTYLYIALPIGWRASHGCFPYVGEGVATAHRDYPPTNPERHGSERLDPRLFVEDTIL